MGETSIRNQGKTCKSFSRGTKTLASSRFSQNVDKMTLHGHQLFHLGCFKQVKSTASHMTKLPGELPSPPGPRDNFRPRCNTIPPESFSPPCSDTEGLSPRR